MRTTGFVLALLVLPAIATAQHARPGRPDPPPSRGDHTRPAEPWPPLEHPRPPAPPPSSIGSIGLPLPSIGLPLPPIGLQPIPNGVQPVPGLNPLPDDPAFAPGHRGHGRPPSVIVVPGYGWGGSYWSNTAVPPAASGVTVFTPEVQVGRLRLDIQPAGQWQLFVDGVFVGMLEDLRGEVDLQPGPRRIEIRAPGYEALVFDARIEAQRTTTYRGMLDPIERDSRQNPSARRDPPNAPPPPVATGSRTIYMIPGCYVGNVPPQIEKLREGCDLSTLKTITP